MRMLVASALLAAACAAEPALVDSDVDPGPVDTVFTDLDGDTIADVHEGLDDPDEDQIPNQEDVDSDDDGLRDKLEAGDDLLHTMPFDTDGDGLPDFVDLDSDDNCLPDAQEGREDSDGDGLIDAADFDDDGDGVWDIQELDGCRERDTDGDGVVDRLDLDSDGDGIDDAVEGAGDSDGDGRPDLRDLDSDDNGVPDSVEGERDLDGDGIEDFRDTDDDGDGLSDNEELAGGTDPWDRDTDGDGQSDLVELTADSDPTDSEEVVQGLVVTVPERTEVEVLVSHELRLRRADLAMLLDTTTSMSATIPLAITDLVALARDLSTELVDPRVGVARFQEYAALPMSGGNDVPFFLEQQMTSDLATALAGISKVKVDPSAGNRDWPETGMEAIYQAMTGEGYDLGCDGTYDAAEDVLPFLSSRSDPFGGTAGQAYDRSDPSTGREGGMGFRPRSTPVVIVVTDADLRDPDAGYAVPGGCPGEAGESAVVRAMNDRGAKIIGLSVNGILPVGQFEDLASATDSYADADGDGVPESLVFSYTPGDTALRADLVRAISELSPALEIDEVAASVAVDEQGFVVDAGEPQRRVSDRFDDGDEVPFTLLLRGTAAASTSDQVFRVVVRFGEDGKDAADQVLWVVVPGRVGS